MVAEAQNSVGEEVAAAEPASRQKAEQIIRKYTLWATGAGLIPVPVLDAVGVAGVQYALVNDLASLYGVPFSKERVRALVAGLVGGGVPALLTTGGLASAAKAVPFVGSLLGAAVFPALSAAATVALGRVFTQHFEAGGTLLDFDAEKTRAFFAEEFENARKEVGETLASAGVGVAGKAKAADAPAAPVPAAAAPASAAKKETAAAPAV